MIIYYQPLTSVLGTLHIYASEHQLRAIFWAQVQQHDCLSGAVQLLQRSNPILAQTQLELSEYFAHQRQHFELPMACTGTVFQRQVWQALLQIDYAQTCSYLQLAVAIARPTAVRAVANAVANNPLSIVIPCHRIIRHSGELGGYAGGVQNKQYLLQHEAA